jgi:hypothetical protein
VVACGSAASVAAETLRAGSWVELGFDAGADGPPDVLGWLSLGA